jgi:hypothetical protein
MRLALLLLLGFIPACAIQGECDVDGACSGGDICARDHTCLSPTEVRLVVAHWTVNGGPANEAPACTSRDLYIDFIGTDRNDTLGFRPVPCANGQFTVDKLPVRFDSVELGAEDGEDFDVEPFDGDGIATLDLRL